MMDESQKVKRSDSISRRAKRRLKSLDGIKDEFGIVGFLAFPGCEGIAPELLHDVAILAKTGLVYVSALQLTILKPAPSEPLSYGEYLHSDEWQRKRLEALDAVGHRCQVCNSAQQPLDVHHRTYERLGDEDPGDIFVLCRQCHRLFHENGRLVR